MRRLALMLLFLLLPMAANGADLYVHHTTYDDSDCTCEATGVGSGPCSLQKGLDCAAAGDNVLAESGTYTLSTVLDVDVYDGSETAPIIVKPASGTVTIDGNSTAATLLKIANNFWRFEDLEFTGSTGSCVWFYGSYYCQLVRVTIHDCGANGFVVEDSPQAYYNSVIDSEIYSNSSRGAYIDGGDTKIVGCYFHDNTSEGFEMQVSRATSVFSIFDGNGDSGIFVASGMRGLVLISNTFYDNGSGAGEAGLYLSATTGNSLCFNNIFSDNNAYGIAAGSGSQKECSIYVSHNAYYNNTSGHYSDVTSYNGQEAVNPTFTDAANGDFSIGTNLKADGWPGAFPGGLSTGYLDIGAVQRQEPAGGGGGWRPVIQVHGD